MCVEEGACTTMEMYAWYSNTWYSVLPAGQGTVRSAPGAASNANWMSLHPVGTLPTQHVAQHAAQQAKSKRWRRCEKPRRGRNITDPQEYPQGIRIA